MSKYDKYVWEAMSYFSSHPEEKMLVMKVPPNHDAENFRKQFQRRAKGKYWRTALESNRLYIMRN